jgi:hypothetical protein
MSISYLLQFTFAVLLNLGVIVCLARGPFRRFPLVLFFCLLQIVLSSGSNIIFFYFKSLTLYSKWYWGGDLIGHVCISLIIISIIREALVGKPERNRIALGLLTFMVGVAVVSLILFHAPQLNRWMTPVSRNLSFGEEVLNLVLWSLLLQRNDFDSQFLIVSAGIGIQVTGEVVGHTLRLYTTKSTIWIPSLLVTLSEFICLIVWIWAFSSIPGKTKALDAPDSRTNLKPAI